MLLTLPIALAQVKRIKTSETLLIEIRKIIYSLYWAKKIPHKINLRRSDKYIALSNLSIYYRWKNVKKVIQKQWT